MKQQIKQDSWLTLIDSRRDPPLLSSATPDHLCQLQTTKHTHTHTAVLLGVCSFVTLTSCSSTAFAGCTSTSTAREVVAILLAATAVHLQQQYCCKYNNAPIHMPQYDKMMHFQQHHTRPPLPRKIYEGGRKNGAE